jgi:8-oxo-dGTP diphosphatase
VDLTRGEPTGSVGGHAASHALDNTRSVDGWLRSTRAGRERTHVNRHWERGHADPSVNSKWTFSLNALMSAPGLTRMVSIAVRSGSCLLVLHRSLTDSLPGYWEIPGGGVEPGESFRRAARRELSEETGIQATCLRKIHRYAGPAPASFRTKMLEFAGFVTWVSPRPDVRLLPVEHSDFKRVRLAELMRLRMMDFSRSVAERAYLQQSPPKLDRPRRRV